MLCLWRLEFLVLWTFVLLWCYHNSSLFLRQLDLVSGGKKALKTFKSNCPQILIILFLLQLDISWTWFPIGGSFWLFPVLAFESLSILSCFSTYSEEVSIPTLYKWVQSSSRHGRITSVDIKTRWRYECSYRFVSFLIIFLVWCQN